MKIHMYAVNKAYICCHLRSLFYLGHLLLNPITHLTFSRPKHTQSCDKDNYWITQSCVVGKEYL